LKEETQYFSYFARERRWATLYIDIRNNCGWIAIEAIKISVEEFDSLEATQQQQQPRQQQQQRLRGPKRLFDNQARPGQARYAQGLTDVVQPRGGPVDGLGKYLDSFFSLFSLGLKMETQLPAKTI
jgi:hypothetical protein